MPDIRLATEDDAPALAALHGAAFSPMDRWGANAIAMMLDMPRGFGLIAEGAGFILARVAADESEIITLAVGPESRRQGVGAALLTAAMALAATRGAASMFLEVAETNEAARALYTAAGFAEVGRRRRYYPDGGTALVLRRSLLG